MFINKKILFKSKEYYNKKHIALNILTVSIYSQHYAESFMGIGQKKILSSKNETTFFFISWYPEIFYNWPKTQLIFAKNIEYSNQ